MTIIDLSVLLNEQTLAFPGDAPTKIEPANRFERDGNNDHYVSFNNHAGTHIDAPWHMLADGQRLHKIPLERFMGRGRLVTLQGGTFTAETIEQAAIAPGDIILFNTGTSTRFGQPTYFENYPAMSEGIAQLLVRSHVSMVGFDTGGADVPGQTIIHRTLLGGDVLIIENLTNLDALADKEFDVYALPIKLDIDAAPARVIAVVKD